MGIPQPESVADHIFRTAILCMIYADLEGLNQLKLIRMALIHDLPEAITGDLTPSKKTKASKDREDTAIDQLLNLLPLKLREKYLMDWKEYQEGKGQAIMFLVGQVMKKTKGKANPKVARELLEKAIKEGG